MSIEGAVKKADVLILGIWFETIREFVAAIARHLSERSLSIHPTRSHSTARAAFRRSSRPINHPVKSSPSCVPKEPNSLKAFCSVSVQSLEAAANRKPELAVLFYATDYPLAGTAVAKLIAASGFAPVSVGGINQSVRIEAFGDLNEYGKLGKLATSKEAEALI